MSRPWIKSFYSRCAASPRKRLPKILLVLSLPTLLLALGTVATTERPVLRPVACVIVVGGIDASILPSPKRKVRKTSHQEQIGKQNKRKRKAVHAQAHTLATTLVAKERMKPKENCRTNVQVIAQVEGEFRA